MHNINCIFRLCTQDDFSLLFFLNPERNDKIRNEVLYKTKTKPMMLYLIKLVAKYMKKLLNSDWQRAVQFKCNTSANYTSYFCMIG